MRAQNTLPQPAPDHASGPEREWRYIVALYEEEGVLAYNLALRITCRRDTAETALERAFVAEARAWDRPGHLVARVVEAAREAAGSGLRAATEGESPQVAEALAALGSLSPTARAALAIDAIVAPGPMRISSILRIPPASAERTLERALEGWGGALELAPEEARRRYAKLPWSELPDDIWGRLAPRVRATLDASWHRRAATLPRAAPVPSQPRVSPYARGTRALRRRASRPGARRRVRSLSRRLWERLLRWTRDRERLAFVLTAAAVVAGLTAAAMTELAPDAPSERRPGAAAERGAARAHQERGRGTAPGESAPSRQAEASKRARAAAGGVRRAADPVSATSAAPSAAHVEPAASLPVSSGAATVVEREEIETTQTRDEGGSERWSPGEGSSPECVYDEVHGSYVCRP